MIRYIFLAFLALIGACGSPPPELPCGHLGQPCCGEEYKDVVPEVPYCSEGHCWGAPEGEPATCRE